RVKRDMLWTAALARAPFAPESLGVNSGAFGEKWALVLLRVIGWLLLLAAVVALGWDGFTWMQSGHWLVTPAGKSWYQLSPGSLNLVQAVIERHIWKPLWNPVILTVLLMPTWVVVGVPGALLAILARPRKRRRFGRTRDS